MANNIPKINKNQDPQRFYDVVRDVLTTLTGQNKNAKYDRALTVRDLERLGIDLDKFLNCDKQNPYPL